MKIEEKAKKYYQTTTIFEISGYMLQDGIMLDFSEGTGAFRQDHANICYFFKGDGTKGYSRYIYKFMRRGNIRLSPESKGFEFTILPTKDQYQTLKQLNKDYHLQRIERYTKDKKRIPFYGFREFEDYIREKVQYEVGYSLDF